MTGQFLEEIMYLPSVFVTWPTAITLSSSACFHCTIHANFGTRNDNVTASQFFPLSFSIIMGLCSVPYYLRSLWFYMTIKLTQLLSNLQFLHFSPGWETVQLVLQYRILWRSDYRSGSHQCVASITWGSLTSITNRKMNNFEFKCHFDPSSTKNWGAGYSAAGVKQP